MSTHQILRDSLRPILTQQKIDHDHIAAALNHQGWPELAEAEGDPAWRILFEECAVLLAPVHPLDLLLEPLFTSDNQVTHLIYATAQTQGVTRASSIKPARYVILTDHGTAAAIDAADVSLDPVTGLDPDLHLRRAQLHATPRRRPEKEAIDRAQVLHAWALHALSARMLAIATEHVTTRHQFGRPVGSFQAVKHMLADCAVELESLNAVATYASESRDPVAVTAARALAGRTAHLVARAAQQVTGAIGFSAEFPLHRYVRRAHSYDLMLGPWPRHARRLGQLILDHNTVPRLGQP